MKTSSSNSTAPSPETLAACALTAHLSVSGELPLSYPQLNLIRAMQLAESLSADPIGDAVRIMGMVARFFRPMQLEFAAELLAEGLTGDECEWGGHHG